MENNILEVHVKSILNNLEVLKKNNPNKKICIPVKANAYGLGYDIIDVLIKEGYNFFSVSTVEEALLIRQKSTDITILMMGGILVEDLETLRRKNITFTVYDFEILSKLEKDDNFHLKFDVGMGRLGFKEKEVEKVLDILFEKTIIPDGLYTHLPQASSKEVSVLQIEKFKTIINNFQNMNINYIHIFNGLGALKYETTFDNMIRPGLVTYGYFESLSLKEKYGNEIKPSLTLKTKITHIKDYSGTIGYDCEDIVNGQVATIPLGYYDGLRQEYRKHVFLNLGELKGKICMCQSMILLTNERYEKGDFVNLIDLENNDIYDLAKDSKVSIYEIIATLGYSRIKRKYII